MTLPSAYLLVAHGSREPRSQIALERLAYLVSQQLETREASLGFKAEYSIQDLRSASAKWQRVQPPLVGTACLELAPLPLHESIRQFAQQGQARGARHLQILPLFLVSGVHLREDIPREVALAQEALGERFKLELRPHLGSYSGLVQLLSRQFACRPERGRILLAHGSRRRGASQAIEAIAAKLNAAVAYWSVTPSLAKQVEALTTAGKESIAILPYFLFAGGISGAIAQQVEQLQLAFPQTKLYLGEPLGATAQLAKLIVEGTER